MSYSDQDVLRAAAIISRTTGNKRGPKPTTDAASIWKWFKWEDRDGEYEGMEDMGDEFAMTSLREHIGDIGYWLGAKSNPRATYAAHVEKNGKRVITVNKIHDNLSAAKNDAAALASLVPGAKGVVVKTAARRTTRRNPSIDMQAMGRRAVMDTAPDARGKAWRGLTAAQARAWIDGMAEADEVDYPVDDASVKAFLAGVRSALTGKATRNPVSEKQALLRAYKAKNTPPHQWAEVRERLLDMGVDLPARGTTTRNPVSEKQALLRAYKSKRTSPHQWDEARERLLDMGVDLPARGTTTRNPPREVVLGHVVVHTKAGYTIPAYKKTFAEMKEVRKWLKAHVAREREAKANPACRCKTKNNPKCRCKK